MIKYSIIESKKIIIIPLDGKLDINNSEKTLKNVKEVISKNPEYNLAFDCAEVAYMSSSAFRVFVNIKKLLIPLKLQVALFNISEPCMMVINMIKMQDYLSIYVNRDDLLCNFPKN